MFKKFLSIFCVFTLFFSNWRVVCAGDDKVPTVLVVDNQFNAGVESGKTELIRRMVNGEFSDDHCDSGMDECASVNFSDEIRKIRFKEYNPSVFDDNHRYDGLFNEVGTIKPVALIVVLDGTESLEDNEMYTEAFLTELRKRSENSEMLQRLPLIFVGTKFDDGSRSPGVADVAFSFAGTIFSICSKMNECASVVAVSSKDDWGIINVRTLIVNTVYPGNKYCGDDFVWDYDEVQRVWMPYNTRDGGLVVSSSGDIKKSSRSGNNVSKTSHSPVKTVGIVALVVGSLTAVGLGIKKAVTGTVLGKKQANVPN